MSIRINVVYSPSSREIHEIALVLPNEANVAQAVQASGILTLYPELDLQESTLGVWGRKTSPDHGLRDQDRVEIYRPLKVDPKVARRARFAKQGARAAGLFARKRSGAKAGD